MTDAKEYRDFAEECLKWAEGTKDDAQRERSWKWRIRGFRRRRSSMPKHDNAPPRAVRFFAHNGEESLYSRRGQAHEAPTLAIGSPEPNEHENAVPRLLHRVAATYVIPLLDARWRLAQPEHRRPHRCHGRRVVQTQSKSMVHVAGLQCVILHDHMPESGWRHDDRRRKMTCNGYSQVFIGIQPCLEPSSR